jgi:hypothetical protein
VERDEKIKEVQKKHNDSKNKKQNQQQNPKQNQQKNQQERKPAKSPPRNTNILDRLKKPSSSTNSFKDKLELKKRNSTQSTDEKIPEKKIKPNEK